MVDVPMQENIASEAAGFLKMPRARLLNWNQIPTARSILPIFPKIGAMATALLTRSIAPNAGCAASRRR